ncbi:MAG: twin-arginine translocation pathway signal protein [Pseudomonadota bacterium]
MNLSRRKTLALIGGGIVAAALPVGGFLATRTPTKALEPWNMAGQYEDPRMRAMSFALLSPNPHNRQPWEAELVSNDGLNIYRDKTRNLPVTDPFERQLTIGMGCFIELMTIAAAEEGFDVETNLFPDGEDGPVASCRFVPKAAQPDPLFKHVLYRRSHKEMFDTKPVSKEVAEPLLTYCDVFLGGKERDQLRQIADDAWWMEMNTKDAYMESVELFRIGKDEINTNPDGIDIGGPMMDTLQLVGILNRETASDTSDPNVQATLQQTSDAITNCPAFAMIRTKSNSRFDQIEAGRKWLRLNLTTTANGLALRPVSQALQEYVEMKEIYEDIHSKFASDGETIQMLGLLGYGERTARTPRWPLETRMKQA